MYVVGGWDNSAYGVAEMDSYNPATNTWSTESPMKTPRYQLAGNVINGIFYAIGDQSFDAMGWVEAYDPGPKTRSLYVSKCHSTDDIWANSIQAILGGHIRRLFS